MNNQDKKHFSQKIQLILYYSHKSLINIFLGDYILIMEHILIKFDSFVNLIQKIIQRTQNSKNTCNDFN